MQAISISFCSGIAHHVTDDAAKEDFLRDISDRLGVKTMMRDAKVFRPDAGHEIKGPYVACTQSRGNAYLLFLTRIGFQDVAIYVDRKVRPGYRLPRIIIDHVMFDHSLFDGTVITGEMVRSGDGEWRFLAEDILALKGKSLSKTGFRTRYSVLLHVLDESYLPSESSTHRIAAKRFFDTSARGLEALEQHAEKMPYRCSGVVLRSLVPGKSNWFFKKDFDNIIASDTDSLTKSLDISATSTPDVYETSIDGETVQIAVQSIDVSKQLASAITGRVTVPWRCKWNDEFGKWMAMPMVNGGRRH